MLSDNLEALQSGFEKYADSGAVLAPEAIRELCIVLESCTEDARRIEAVIISGRELPAGVSDLAARRATVQMRSWPRGGGD